MIKIRLAKVIAQKGTGFFDLDGKQTILPPIDKAGKPDADNVFSVNETAFVREKLRTGELVLADEVKTKEKAK